MQPNFPRNPKRRIHLLQGMEAEEILHIPGTLGPLWAGICQKNSMRNMRMIAWHAADLQANHPLNPRKDTAGGEAFSKKRFWDMPGRDKDNKYLPAPWEAKIRFDGKRAEIRFQSFAGERDFLAMLTSRGIKTQKIPFGEEILFNPCHSADTPRYGEWVSHGDYENPHSHLGGREEIENHQYPEETRIRRVRALLKLEKWKRPQKIQLANNIW